MFPAKAFIRRRIDDLRRQGARSAGRDPGETPGLRLTTERLVLELERADRPAPAARRLDEPVHGPVAQGEAAVEGPPREFYVFAVLLPPRRPAGRCLLRIRDAAAREAEIMWVLDRPHRGRGYATEAAHAVLLYGFADLGLQCISATCRADNAASARILGKLGLRRQESPEVPDPDDGSGRVVHRYRLLRGEWQAGR